MKNILRFIIYVVFCYAAFALSDAIYAFFDTIFAVYTVNWPTTLQATLVPSLPGWIICGILLNFCVRSRLTVPGSVLALSWLVVIGPFLLLFLVERGVLTLPVAGLFNDPMPLVIQCFAFIASFITVNHMTNR
ncbi:MAG: hypothetical protein UDB11_02320 [Peptococcaceae bacterium]|nr:hypothetical protein [Peptococcaceae bacterium]